MRIRITSATSVADGAGRRYLSGQTVDVDDDLGAAWVAAGHAQRVSGKPDKRTATRPAPRTAASGRDSTT